MIEISNRGYQMLNADLLWDKYAKEHGIRDPFAASRNKLFAVSGIEIEFDEAGRVKQDPNEPTKEEKDNYRKQKDAFLADWFFYNIDYDAFLFKANEEMRQMEKYVPCASIDAQCRMECPKI